MQEIVLSETSSECVVVVGQKGMQLALISEP